MTRLIDLLQRAAAELGSASGSSRLDAEVLLAHALRCRRSELSVRRDADVGEEEERAFRGLIASRIAGMPVAYLTGVREFWSLPLQVSPAVLVPRPETEILVEHALRLIDSHRLASVLDLGTGSGAIALAIARERPAVAVTATDLSEAALELARRNAQMLGIANIRWRAGSWFDAVPGVRFDLIASNPPYVAAADPHLAALKAEPRMALTPGPTGLEAYQAIIPRARSYLNPTGWIAFEHGASQAADVANLLEQNSFFNVTSHPDYSATLRVTLGSIHSNA
jgi:release factor glutamine methyltransferase